MGAITITKSAQLNLGNRDALVAKCGNIDDGDTWKTGMSVIEHVDIKDTVSGTTYGYTVSGGTISFACSAQLTAPTVFVLGFN